jgi:hypothetical protein
MAKTYFRLENYILLIEQYYFFMYDLHVCVDMDMLQDMLLIEFQDIYFHRFSSHDRSVLMVFIHLFFWSVKEYQSWKVIIFHSFLHDLISLYHIYHVHKFSTGISK